MQVTVTPSKVEAPRGLSVAEIGKSSGVYISRGEQWKHLVFGVFGGGVNGERAFFFYNHSIPNDIFVRTAKEMEEFAPFVKSDRKMTITI